MFSSALKRSHVTITALLLLVSGLLLLPTSRADAAVPAAPTITSKPAASTNSTSATFGFSRSEAGGTLECAVDDPFSFVTCTSPTTYSGLAENSSHTFYVRQLNVDGPGPSATYTWEIDTVRPADPLITDGPPRYTNSTAPVTFTFAAAEPGGTMECGLSVVSYAPCSSRTSQTYSGLTGSNTFYVRQRDDAGNAAPYLAAHRDWTVDTAPPEEPTLFNYPAAVETSATAYFGGQAYGGSSFQAHTFNCQLDANPWAVCTMSSAGTFSASYGYEDGYVFGPHTFRVTETDEAGNTGAPTVYSWTYSSSSQPVTPVVPVQPVVPVVTPPVPTKTCKGVITKLYWQAERRKSMRHKLRVSRRGTVATAVKGQRVVFRGVVKGCRTGQELRVTARIGGKKRVQKTGLKVRAHGRVTGFAEMSAGSRLVEVHGKTIKKLTLKRVRYVR